jgi:energy-coupling factor transporter ATP-binding protein EcfA2
MNTETTTKGVNSAALTSDERTVLVEQIFVNFPRLNRVKEKIAYCHQHSKVAAEPECLLITGQTGAGKTTLCQVYSEQFPRSQTKEGITSPILSALIPVPATAKSLVTRLLDKLGDPMAVRGTTVTQTLRLVRLIRECEVELIILDLC